jgi:predicted RNA-binding Zn-ribbon protein involved in translation (DUF1610 family)
MAKKKSKKKIPKFKCCGEEECTCSKNEKINVYVCPRCQSVDVGYSFGLKNIFGIIPRMKCKNCGFEAMTFPKWYIEKNKITNKTNNEWKREPKKEKTKKVSYKKKVVEKYCPNCEDKVQVTMKDGSVDTFICDNCKFEIKEKK